MTERVVVVGAGVAGLATAYRLLQAEPSIHVTVLEASERVGGRVASVCVGDLELDAGPESFAARKPGATALCRDLGLELVEPQAHGSFVWTDRGLSELPPTALGVPAGIDDVARWPGLSRGGRARVLGDLVKRRGPSPEDEPLGALLRRRLGDEWVDAVAQPVLGGLYAGDVDRLSLRATFPELAFWAREHGALLHGARAAHDLGREAGPMFLRPRVGMATLPAALADAVGRDRVRTSTRVTGIRAEGRAFVVEAGEVEFSASAVMVATPASEAGVLLGRVAPAASRELAAMTAATIGVVLLAYPEGTASALPAAGGFVVPRGKAPMLSASFTSSAWPDPAFGSRAVVRCLIGGVGAEDVVDAPDDQIVEAVARHLAAVLPLPAEPADAVVVRWHHAMPQPGVGHLERVAAVAASLPPGIVVVGDAIHGVGLADVARGADETAARVLRHLLGAERERVR